MITLWGRASSSNVQAVRWCLHELNLEYDRIDAGFTYGVVQTEAYLKINPNGTVPTLQDSENPPLFETGAILRYLARTYAPDSFWPTEPVHRASVDMWAEWSKINIALNFTAPVFWPVARVPKVRRDHDQIAAGKKIFEDFLSIANERLAQSRFLASDDITLADIQFGHLLYRYYDIDLSRAELPHVRRYYDMLSERAAFQDTVMVSYEELVNSL